MTGRLRRTATIALAMILTLGSLAGCNHLRKNIGDAFDSVRRAVD